MSKIKFKMPVVAAFFLLVLVPVFSEELFVQKTKGFDIIYTKKSEKTAALIAEYADVYAEEICKKLNKKFTKRMPVYIMPDKEVLNAYYARFPYRRIILFDTIPTDGSLSSFKDNILKVFYHELTHAISKKLFLPFLPLSFSEGVSVLLESDDGEQGRLNDPFIMHHLMQGKIEGTTPDWREAAGNRDVYPGAFWGYIYGAAFAKYLQNVYGMETYSKYWHSSILLFPRSKTKNIFNKKLKYLWANFVASIYFPQKVQKPTEFLDTNKKSGYSIFANNTKGFACFDFAKKDVLFYTLDGKKEKLFNANPTVTNLNFSQNGSLLLVTDFINTMKGETSRAFIYDMYKKKILNRQYDNIRYAAFVGNKEICGVEVNKQFSKLILVDAYSFKKQKDLFKVGPGLDYSAIYSPVMAGKNKIAFIAANGLKRDILIVDIKTNDIQKIEFEKDLYAIRYLHTNSSIENPVLTFSWADKNMLYRAAIYKPNTGELRLLDKDISGGVFSPIYFETKNKNIEDKEIDNLIIYIGIHSKFNSIYKIKENEFSSPLIVKLNDLMLTKKPAKNDKKESQEKILPSKKPKLDKLNFEKYNYASWLCRPFPLPALKVSDSFIKNKQIAFGFRLHGLDATESVEYLTYSYFYVKPFFYETTVDIRIKNFNISIYDINNDFMYRTLGSTLKGAFLIPTNLLYQNFYLDAGLSFESFAFFDDKLQEKTFYAYKLGNPVLTENVSASYSFLKTIYKLDNNFFAKNKEGVEVAIGAKHAINFESKTNSFVLQSQLSGFTPIVPFRFSFGTYLGYNAFYNPVTGAYSFFNSPSNMGLASYLPKMNEYSVLKNKTYKTPAKLNFGFSFDNEISIFNYEIQRGSSFLPAFYNRINTSLGYRIVLNLYGGGALNNLMIFQSAYAKFTFDISGAVNIGLEYAHPIEKVKMGKFNMILDINF